MKCSGKNLVCCKVPENLTSTVTTEKTVTTESPPESKTITPLTRYTIFQIDKGCGIARTDIGTRILTDGIEIENTIPGEVPWIVAIFKKNRLSNTYTFKCAGTLVHPRVVLTACHCVLS